jgi:hypothetical protein
VHGREASQSDPTSLEDKLSIELEKGHGMLVLSLKFSSITAQLLVPLIKGFT